MLDLPECLVCLIKFGVATVLSLATALILKLLTTKEIKPDLDYTEQERKFYTSSQKKETRKFSDNSEKPKFSIVIPAYWI